MGILYARATDRSAGAGAAGAAGAAGDGGRAGNRSAGFWVRARQSVPLFVLGFLAMAALNSLGVFRELSIRANRDLVQDAQWTARVLILVALAGVGLSTRLDAMRKAGLRPLYVGFIVAAATSAACLAWIRFLGPASQ
jgi:uncharacterized membrane protein YadS